MRGRRAWTIGIVAACVSVGAFACSGSTTPAGGVMLVFSSDMSIPKDIDTLHLDISQNGVTLWGVDYPVGPASPATYSLPSTLLVLPPTADPTTPVLIRLAGLEAGVAHVLRDAILVIPADHVAQMRMPVEWLCEGSGANGPTSSAGAATYVPSLCTTTGTTCMAGACLSATVDPSTLPTYDPTTVFGGGTGAAGGGGTCFDTISCFGQATLAAVDTSTCTFQAPSGGVGTNVAVLVGHGDPLGICGPEACLVPLDANSSEGWQANGTTIQLPAAVCARIASGDAAGVLTTTTCAAKTESVPTCGPWSAVAGGLADAGQQINLSSIEDGGNAGAGLDATLADAGAPDATTLQEGDGGSIQDGSTTSPDVSAPPATCAAVLAAMQSATINPPTGWLGLDFSGGAGFNGTFPTTGGLTVDQALGQLSTASGSCEAYSEPTSLAAGVSPISPGTRMVGFGANENPEGGAPAYPMSLFYNVESRTVEQVTLIPPYTGGVQFHGRAGGAYPAPDGGTNVYSIGLGASSDGGTGYVTRNGQDFPADWSFGQNDAGAPTASAWVNELYDGLMATYDPTVPAVPDCLEAPFNRIGQLEPVPSCFNYKDGYILGVRPLYLYFSFGGPTNQPTSIYSFWPSGAPSCSTPQAVNEVMDWSPIKVTQGWTLPALSGFQPPSWTSVSIGGISPSQTASSDAGLLATEANTLEGCSGVPLAAPDVGYPAEAWGASEEVLLEYDDAGVAYRLFAQKGYQGTLSIQAPLADGGTDGNSYVIAPQLLLQNGETLDLNWGGGVAGVDSVITDISNAWIRSWCGSSGQPIDTDCSAAGDCVITPDDGKGSSSFTLQTSTTTAASCGLIVPPLTVAFATGTSVPTEIYTTNLPGK